MGKMIDGVWHDRWYPTEKSEGRFQREETQFRDTIGAPDGRFPAANGRYHLYVSLACPWAHRTLIVRTLKRLEGVIGVSVVEPVWGDEGWVFGDADDRCTPDRLYGSRHLHEIYTRARADYTGRVTVPILWDAETETIVSNESAEIIRMLDSAFDEWGDGSLHLSPPELLDAIEEVNAEVYPNVNNGVYRAGFATTQEAYEEAFDALFSTLDRLEERLSARRWLVGGRLTEADVRLFTTLARFDAVYQGHFKCNLRRLVDYPNLWGFTRDLYQQPGVAETLDLDHIKRHYYGSHGRINPTGVVPKGPALDFDAPHDRAALP